MSVETGQPFSNLSINYVAPATCADGTLVILKAGVPTQEILTEIAALRHFDGKGAVKILKAEPERAIMLLKRLLPGTSLLELNDDLEAARITAGVMARLKTDAPTEHSFPSVKDWFAGDSRRQFFLRRGR